MLSIEECRELIPDSNKFADKQIEEIREDLYGLAELALESYSKNMSKDTVVYQPTLTNLLVTGIPGSGMSNFTDFYLTSLLNRYGPTELQIILVDPKRVQLSQYKHLPHVMEVVHDLEPLHRLLAWAETESVRRLKVKETKQALVLIEEAADFLVVDRKALESSIRKITQHSQETGIYVFLATARVESSILSQDLLDCFSTRIAFRVKDEETSLLVLGQKGSERLSKPGSCYVRNLVSNEIMQITMPFVGKEDIEALIKRVSGAKES